MPITIQEIIASDTISQLVDKTNFNFDQLLLNGGGPAGPAGIQGPVGPGGGRGSKGTTWYEDTATTAPGTTPTASFPTLTPLPNDYYLQFNGQVWEYTGLAWSITTIDLQGPTGPAGQSGGFGLKFGSPYLNLETAIYNGPIGEGVGATPGNEGVPSIMIGGAVSSTTPLGTIPLTNAYIIPNAIAEQVISSRVSALIHQKDATSKAIVFHGGAATSSNNFEQSTFNNLSSIAIGTDDKFVINGAGSKPSTDPVASLADIVGFNVITERRGQSYEAGKFITFSTGNDNIPYSGMTTEDSSFNINVNNGSSSAGNSFEVSVSGSLGNSLLRLGNIVPAIQTPLTTTGSFGLEAGLVQVATSSDGKINLFSGGAISLDTTRNSTSNGSGVINLLTNTGNIKLRTVSPNDLTSQLGNINITQEGSSVGARGNIIIENRSTLPNTTTGGDIVILGNSNISLRKQSPITTVGILASPSIIIDFGTTSFPEHTRMVGQTTYSPVGQLSSVPPISVDGQYDNIQHYYDATLPAVSGSDRTLMQMGSASANTNLDNGAVYNKWINTEGVLANANDAPSIRIGKGGNDTGALELSGRADNAAGVQGKPEWWNLSEKQVMWAVPEIINRDSRKGSNAGGYDNATVGTVVAGTPSTYAWDTSRLGIEEESIIPKLEQPFIDVTFGPNLKGAGNTNEAELPEVNTANFNYIARMPIGTIAGSRYEIDIQNRSACWYALENNVATLRNYWGTILFKVPIMRAKLASSATWQPWVYQDYEITAPQASPGTTAGEAYVARLAGMLTWNGAIRSGDTGPYTTPATSTVKQEIDVQMGWSTGGLPDNVSVVNIHGSYIGA